MRAERTVGRLLRRRRWTLALAESCTGGLLAGRIASVPGCSAYFRGGIVAYANDVKTALLGVPRRLLAERGAVSEPTARRMADGARRRLRADVGVATTGIAGPAGGSAAKPVGLVFAAVAGPAGVVARRFDFAGGRAAVQSAACRAALGLLRQYLQR